MKHFLAVFLVIVLASRPILGQEELRDTLYGNAPNNKKDYITVTERTYKSGDLTMTDNQYKVMPASFQDPSRILIRYPGFSTQNDGANAIIFRGMPPEATRWQLFSADIVNPNHLSNAGTANDLATGNAGGVNAISGSVLGHFHFEANPAHISTSNVMAGIADMKLSPRINSFIDFNLIGFEAGYNFARGNYDMYAAYRYSFVGVLDKLGVNFGGEKIGFQDVTFSASLLNSKNTNLKIFSTLGNSSNIFKAVALGDSITRFKDIQNITYRSNLKLLGGRYSFQKENLFFNSTLVYSYRKDYREEFTSPDYVFTYNIEKSDEKKHSNSVLSWHSQFVFSGKNLKTMAGLRMNHHSFSNLEYTKQYVSIYPYVSIQNDELKKWKYKLGLGSLYDNRTNEVTVEPNIMLACSISKNLLLSTEYRFSSFQDLMLGLQTIKTLPYAEKKVKLHNLQGGIKFQHKGILAKATLYYHQIFDMPSFHHDGFAGGRHFSPFNGSNFGYDQIFDALTVSPSGFSRARIIGSEFYFENTHTLNKKHIHYGLNFSIYDSKYALADNPTIYYNGRYNFRHTSNAFIQYTIQTTSDKRQKNFTFSISQHYRGGIKEQSLLFVNGDFATLYDPRSPYKATFRPYSRLDFRIVYKRKKHQSNKTHRWSLDIQNVLGTQNDGFRYYDPLLNSVLLQKQLGLVPVLSYRLEWGSDKY